MNPIDFRLQLSSPISNPLPDATLKAYRSPRDEGRAFYSVNVIVANPLEARVHSQDHVELSDGAYQLVARQACPRVAALRLPPRFPTSTQWAIFRGQILRNGRS